MQRKRLLRVPRFSKWGPRASGSARELVRKALRPGPSFHLLNQGLHPSTPPPENGCEALGCSFPSSWTHLSPRATRCSPLAVPSRQSFTVGTAVPIQDDDFRDFHLSKPFLSLRGAPCGEHVGPGECISQLFSSSELGPTWPWAGDGGCSSPSEPGAAGGSASRVNFSAS